LLFLVVVLLGAVVLIFTGGGRKQQQDRSQPSAGTGTLQVVVSILPERFFAERIGGGTVSVSVLVPPGKEPHEYDPSPRQIAALGRADVYFTIGVPFESVLVPRISRSLPELSIVDVTRGVTLRRVDGGIDPHTWMSPENALIESRNIRDALIRLRPQNEELYRANYNVLAAQISELTARLKRLLAPVSGDTLFVYHPAFGYFADAFGLHEVAVQTGGGEPTAATLERMIRQAQEHNVHVIFVQPQFSRAAAQNVANAIGGAVVAIDPLAADWLSNMEIIAQAVKEGLTQWS